MLFLLFAFAGTAKAQTTIYSENFTAATGTTSGSYWYLDMYGCSVSSSTYMKVVNNILEARFTNCDATFYTYPIDISQYSNVSLSALVSEIGSLESTDRFQLMYSLDGAAYQYFATNGSIADDFTSVTASQTGISGKTVSIKFIALNSASDEAYMLDNILVRGYAKDNFVLSATKTNASCSAGGTVDLNLTPGMVATSTTSPYVSTGCTYTMSGSSSYTLNAGQTGCVTGTFTGSVTINGGTMINGGTANPSTLNFYSGVLVNNGTMTVSNFGIWSGREVYNYGTLTNSGTLSLSGQFFNYGTLTTGGLDINSGAGMLNIKTVQVNGTFNNNSYYINSGSIVVTSTLNNNSSANFTNNGTITANAITHNGYMDNHGSITVTGLTTTYSGSNIILNSGSSLSTGSLSLIGTVSNTPGACTKLSVAGTTTLAGGSQITGPINLCDANGIEYNYGTILSGGAALNCNCSGGGYTYLWSNGATTPNISGLAAGTYSVTVTGPNGSTASASAIVGGVGASGDPNVFGNNVWNVYAWNAGNASGGDGAWTNNYRGYYVISSLNFDTRTGQTYSTAQSWADNLSPSSASGYLGCSVNNDNHSYAFKRQGFPCGYYQINLPNNDDRVELYVDGALQYFNNSCCSAKSNIWSGFLGGSTMLELRISEGGGGSHGSIELVKQTDITVSTTTPGTRCGTGTVSLGATASIGSVIDWYAASSGGSVLSGGTGTNSFATPSISSTTTYYAQARNAGTGCVSSRTAVVATITGGGSASISGTNTICTGGSSTFTATGGGTYAWSTGATSAAISVSTAGTYTVTVTNGGCTTTASRTLTVNAKPSATVSGTNSICSGGSSTFTAAGGGTYAWSTGATIAAITVSTAGTYTVTVTSNGCTATANRALSISNLSITSSSADMTCTDGSRALTASVAGGTWSGTGVSGSSFSPSTAGFGTQTITYTVGGCTATQQIDVTAPGNPTVFGSEVWNVYAWNAGDASGGSGAWTTNYRGYYVINSLNFDTRTGQTYSTAQSWGENNSPSYAVGYLGCFVGTDAHSYAFKRQGFPCGNYQINLPNHDDRVQLYVDGVLAYDLNGCCATRTNIWSGFLGASSTLELRIAEGGGGSHGSIELVKLNDIDVATTTPASRCGTGTVVLQATPTSGSVINWYAASSGGSILSGGGATNNFTTPSISSTTTYYAQASHAATGCLSARVAVAATVGGGGTASISGTNSICTGGSSTFSATGGGTYAWSTGATTAAIMVSTAGTYTVTVTNGSCTSTASRVLTVNTTPTAAISGTQTICSGASSTFTATGGGTYAWSTGASTAAISVNIAGTYTVTVTSASGCTATANRVLNVNTTPTAAISGTQTICAGNTSTFTATGGGTYAWSTGATTAAITLSTTGTYTVTVTSNGCTAIATQALTVNATPTATISSTNVTCGFCTNGTASISASGGTAPLTYLWSNGSTATSLSNLAPATYTVTITDALGCTVTKTTTVNLPLQVNIAGASACSSGSGSATASGIGGAAPYSFIWSNGAITATINNLASGTYNVTGTDANGVTATQSVVISNTNIVGSMTPASGNICLGQSVQLNASGADIYTWTPTTGLSNPNIANPIATPTVTTTYYLNLGAVSGELVTNGNFNAGNTGFTSAYGAVYAPGNGNKLQPEGLYAVDTNASNYHNNFFGTDHTGGGNFMIINGATIAGQTIWSQTVNITPNTIYNFSTWISSVHASSPAQLRFEINGVLLGPVITAPGATSQWVQFNTTWNSGAATSAVISIVNENAAASGNDYGLDDISFTTVCNVNHGSIPITVRALPIPSAGVDKSICTGSSTSLTATGAGTGGSYAWSSGAVVATTTVSPTTTTAYTVTVTNSTGCSAMATASVTVNAKPTVSIVGTNVGCYGASTGTATTTVTGGTSPYTYNWGGGIATQDRTGLAAGSYTVTVNDANGCTGTASVTITQPASAISRSLAQVNVLCNGASTGTATLTVSGGTSPYAYNWGGGITTQNRTGLAAGTYTVTITDANTCTSTVSATITQPTALSATATPTSVSCYSAANGSIALSVSGGTTAYTYNWGAGITTQNRSSLAPGTYTVTITDAGACTATASATITQPAAALSGSLVGINVGCYGASTGTATLTVAGGTSPYTYNWGSGITTQNRTGLAAGTYTVTITDARACTATASVTITQPAAALSGSLASVNVACYGGSTGTATLTVTGGTSPYTYNWGGGITTQNRTGLAAGTYTVTITDASSCTATVSKTITQPASALAGTATPTNIGCYGTANGSIALSVSGGTTAYTYNWGAGITTQNRTALAPGTYTVTITDAGACTATASATITQPAAALSGSLVGVNVGCYGASTGTATLTVAGGTSPYTYNWGGGITTQNRTGLAAGTYIVTIADAGACTATASVTITQPTAALSGSLTSVNVACYGGSTGTATLTVTGGTSPYTYNWGGGITTQNRTGLAAGSYSVTITDASSCTATVSKTITQATAISATATPTNVSCYGTANGSIALSVSGGTSAYTYNWGGGITTQNRSSLAPGTYTVTITDAGACTATASATITQPAATLSGSLASVNVGCYGASTGTATLTVSGGTSPYTYNWGGGITTQNRTGLVAGTYTVTITDASSCTATASVTISQPAAALSLSTVVTNQTSGNNGAISLTVAGGTSAYTYNWGSGITTQNRTGLAVGSYTVTVTDAAGCTATTSAAVITSGPCTCIATGNWSSASTWSGNCSGGGGKYAGYLDDIIIQGYKVTVDSAHTVKSLILKESATDTTRLLFTNTNSLNVLNGFSMNTTAVGKNVEVDIDGSADFIVNGDFAISHSRGTQVLISLNRNNGTNAKLWVKGNLDMTMATNSGSLLVRAYAASDTIRVDGDIIYKNNNTSASADMFITMSSSSKLFVNGNIDFRGVRNQNMELIMSNTSVLALKGSLLRKASPSKFGKLTMNNTSALVLNGSEQQILDGTTGNTDNNLYRAITVNNSYSESPQVLLNGDVTITTSLTMQDGNIGTGNYMVILSSNAATALSGHSANSYIVGTLRRYITSNTASYDFPLGYGAPNQYYWARIKNNLMVGPTYLTASFGAIPANESATPIRVTDNGQIYTQLNPAGIWTIDPNTQPILGSYTIEVCTENFEDLVDDNFRLIKRPTMSGIQSWNTGNIARNLLGALDLLASTGITKLPNLTSFSDFGIGQGAGSSLPIDLVSFGAKPEGEKVRLDWTVSMEINNDYFTIERSMDGVDFEPVAVVKGAGNHSTETEYFTYDEQPLMGLSYYRLKQTDFDGAWKTYDMVSVTMTNKTTTTFDIYPNPNKGSFTIQLETAFDEINVSVLNNMGQLVYFNELIGTTGKTKTQMDLGEILATGVYFVKIDSGKDTFIKQMVIE